MSEASAQQVVSRIWNCLYAKDWDGFKADSRKD